MRFRVHQGQARASTLKLVALFLALVVAMVVVVNLVLAVAYKLTLPMTAGFPAYFFATNTAVVLLFVLGGAGVESLRIVEGGAHVARMAGARPAQPSANNDLGRLERRLANILTEMALASRMRKPPAAWVLHRDDSINAFAAGWADEDRVVCVTRGALERLTREELQGVVAHEFAHLQHGDTALNMRLIGLVWGLQMIHGFGRSLAESDEPRRLPVSALFGYALMGVGWLGWLGGRLLQMAVSRQREFHADASAVAYTRLVAGLGGALRKIGSARASGGAHAHPSAPGRDSVAHLWLDLPGDWLCTHPPLHERLQRLYGRAMEPLPAPLLPTPADEALLPFLPLATPAALAPKGASNEATRHDPLQASRAQTQAAATRDALMRIERWHGPMEKRAAMLALLLDHDDEAAWTRWVNLMAQPKLTTRLRADLNDLNPESRIAVFSTMAARMASSPPSDQALLRAQARTLVQSPMGRLRRVTMLSLLRPRPRLPKAWATPWDQNLPAVVMGTAALSQVLSPGNARGWLGEARQQLQATHVGPPPRPRWSIRGLRRMAPMDRPRLLAAWVKATRRLGLMGQSSSREALHLVALALDTPLPHLRDGSAAPPTTPLPTPSSEPVGQPVLRSPAAMPLTDR